MGQFQNLFSRSQPYSSPGSGRGYAQPRGDGAYSGMPGGRRPRPGEMPTGGQGQTQGISREPVPPAQPPQNVRGIDTMPRGGISQPMAPPPGTGGVKPERGQPQMSAPLPPPPQMSTPMPPPQQPGQGTPYSGPGPVRSDASPKVSTKPSTVPGTFTPVGTGQPLPNGQMYNPTAGQASSIGTGQARRNPYRGEGPPEYSY